MQMHLACNAKFAEHERLGTRVSREGTRSQQIAPHSCVHLHVMPLTCAHSVLHVSSGHQHDWNILWQCLTASSRGATSCKKPQLRRAQSLRCRRSSR